MRKVLSSILIFFVVFFIFSATKVSAKVLSNDKGTVTVAKGEVINDDLFIGAQTAEIDGVVNGDVFIGAQTVRITGTIKGSVYVGAQNVDITAANIGGSLLSGSQNISIDKNSVIGGSVFLGAASVKIDSQVKRSAYIGAGSLTLGQNAKIGKDLYYSAAQNQVNLDKGAKISGNIYKSEFQTPQKNIEAQKARARDTRVFGEIVSFLGALIVGFISLKFFGRHFSEASNLVSNSFWKSLGTGFLITIAFIPGLIILLITIIGIPLAGLAFITFLIYSYLAKIVVGSAFGNFLSLKFNWKMSVFWAFALGLLAIYILKMIPFIGGLAGFVVFLTGLGALTLHTFLKSN